jgi:hypothetical protein
MLLYLDWVHYIVILLLWMAQWIIYLSVAGNVARMCWPSTDTITLIGRKR